MLELNKLYNMDCMAGMREFPDKYFELAIVDPPYGININMNMGRKKGQEKKHQEKDWDGSIPNQEYFDELFRISQNQIIWGGNYFPLPLTKAWIFWDKEVPEGVSFADGELAWTSFDKTLVKARIPYSGFQGMDDGGKIHPTQKPVKLYKWILMNYAKQGYKIIDTHVGSASSLLACYDMGLDYIGFEIDKDYFKLANTRIEENKLQVRMII
jgi:site-specific DNA-methyltransferase (adenine-specific)